MEVQIIRLHDFTKPFDCRSGNETAVVVVDEQCHVDIFLHVLREESHLMPKGRSGDVIQQFNHPDDVDGNFDDVPLSLNILMVEGEGIAEEAHHDVIAKHDVTLGTVCIAYQHLHRSWLIVNQIWHDDNNKNLPTLIVAQTESYDEPTLEILHNKAITTIKKAASSCRKLNKAKTVENQSCTRKD
jgi:hypothetical protein